MVDLDALADAEITARETFTVAAAETTNTFGEQSRPPGAPAAADAGPDEAVRVLGSPDLLARVEFLARESLRGHLPPGTGCAGEGAEVTHRRAAPLGSELVVETELVGVDGASVTFEGRVSHAEGTVVGTARTTIRIVDRERFRASLS